MAATLTHLVCSLTALEVNSLSLLAWCHALAAAAPAPLASRQLRTATALAQPVPQATQGPGRVCDLTHALCVQTGKVKTNSVAAALRQIYAQDGAAGLFRCATCKHVQAWATMEQVALLTCQ